jgi:hypothetical protein
MSDWEQDLETFFRARGETPHPSTSDLLVRRNEEAHAFIMQTVVPAFETVHAALAQYGREALLSTAHQGRLAASIRVRNEGRDEFEYLIGIRVTPDRAAPTVEIVTRTGWPRRASESALREGSQDYSASDITKDEVIRHFVSSYIVHLTG